MLTPNSFTQNRQLTATFRADTAAKRNELADLSAKPVTFTATRCASCGAGLDLPTVHFMCKHSFHQRCLDTASVRDSRNVTNSKSTRSNGNARARSRRRSRRTANDGNDNHDDGDYNNEYNNNDSSSTDASDGNHNDNDDEDDDYDDVDEDIECPVCAPQNATVRAIRRAQAESAHRHDMFLDALGRSKDGFGTVSEWFGRGVMNK